MIILRSVGDDLPLGLDLSQLWGELLALSISVTLEGVRVDGDVLTIAASASPSGGDTATIDACLADHDPSVETPEEVAGAQLEVFGAAYAYAEEEAVQVRLSESWEEILSLAIPELEEAGDYRIAWFYEWSADTTSDNFMARVEVDDSTEISRHHQEAKDSGGSSIGGSGTDQRHVASGFKVLALGAGSTPHVDIDIMGEDNDYEVTIYRARLEFWRVR